MTYARQDRARATARSTRRGRPRRSSAPCARCARTSAPGCRCRTAAFLGVLAARVDGETLAPAGGRAARRGRPAAARLPRRRARAARGPAARQAADGGGRLAARPPGSRARRLLARPAAAGALAGGARRAGHQRVALATPSGRRTWRRSRRRGDEDVLAIARELARRDDPPARAVAAYVLGQLGAPERTFPAESAAALEELEAPRGGPRRPGDDRQRVRPPRRAVRHRDAAAAAPPPGRRASARARRTRWRAGTTSACSTR